VNSHFISFFAKYCDQFIMKQILDVCFFKSNKERTMSESEGVLLFC